MLSQDLVIFYCKSGFSTLHCIYYHLERSGIEDLAQIMMILMFSHFCTIIGQTHTFWVVFRGPGGFRELREGCSINFHPSWYLSALGDSFSDYRMTIRGWNSGFSLYIDIYIHMYICIYMYVYIYINTIIIIISVFHCFPNTTTARFFKMFKAFHATQGFPPVWKGPGYNF